MSKVVKGGSRVFGKSGIAALVRHSKFLHIRFVRGTLLANVVTHQSEGSPKMQFNPSVFTDEFTPREVSARPLGFFPKLKLETLRPNYRIENFDAVE